MVQTKENRTALVHGYGYDSKRHGRPNPRGRFGTLAASELYRQDRINKIVLTGGQTLANRPPLAEVMGDQLRRNLRGTLGDEDLIVSPTAQSTRQEIKAFKEIVERDQIGGDLVLIASKTHLPRVKKGAEDILGRLDRQVEVVGVEDILTYGVESTRYWGVLGWMGTSGEETAFKRQEAILNRIESWPGGVFVLELLSKLLVRKEELQMRAQKLFGRER